jgi:hypothetical protein
MLLLTLAFLCFALQILAWMILPASAPEPAPATVDAEVLADPRPA